MQPNIIERVWRQDKMVNVDVLNGFTFTDEEEAHRFIISGKNVNTPVAISGTITANFKNADGVLVPLTGTIEDGKAVVVLSRECYAVEGPFSLMIFADTVCIYAAIANVINSSGEVIAYPTAAIPDVHELIVEAQEIVHRLDNGYNSFPTVTAGPADIVTATDGADDIPLKTLSVAIEPKQDLHGYDKPWVGGAGKNKLIDSGYVQGVLGWNETTADNISANVHFITSPYMPINNNTAYTLSAIHGNVVRIYVTDENHNKLYFRGNNPVEGSNEVIPATSGAVYLRVSIGIDAENVIPSDYGTKVYAQLELGSAATSYEPYSNICPITGWDEATVTRTGKNLISNGTNTANGYVAGKYLKSDGTMDNSANLFVSEYTPVIPGETYTAISSDVAYAASVCYYNSAKEYIGGNNYNGRTSFTVTMPSNAAYFRATQYNVADQIYHWFMFEKGSTATTYEPYQGQSVSVNLSSVAGSTVYGGTVTINEDGTGTLVVDRAKVTLTGNESLAYSTSTKSFYHDAADTVPGIAGKEYTVAFDGVCDRFAPYDGVTAWANLTTAYVGYVNATSSRLRFSIPGETEVTESVRAKLAGMEVAYKLATPQTFTLTATQLRTLLGHNTIWCDAGQVSMTYRADTKMYIDRKIAELAASIVNS